MKSIRCPKCGELSISVIWTPCDPGRDNEKLSCKCLRCEFRWEQKPLDYVHQSSISTDDKYKTLVHDKAVK